ncbi:hypothetical protein [Nannocystis bainbridge]|uniref:Uncharacterized protein n=1 Tax=Nannocystis bainbridge TaxID=2995303 RepID=A0ABT5DTN3_9BACT|nr:hypothetical protein [Nannocystis bainbridge]MDC0716503.1 hypothetical protein [Nannocystis bainbridge]
MSRDAARRARAPLAVGRARPAFARDLDRGTAIAPSFRDAVKLHHLVDTIAEASASGQRKLWQRP